MAILRGGRRIGNYDIRIGMPRDRSLVDVAKDPRLKRQPGGAGTIQRFSSNAKFDQSTKIQATYQQVKSNKYVKASIKRYLYSQVRSNFLRIDVNEMALAAYLPVADFQGATLGQVFARTRRTY